MFLFKCNNSYDGWANSIMVVLSLNKRIHSRSCLSASVPSSWCPCTLSRVSLMCVRTLAWVQVWLCGWQACVMRGCVRSCTCPAWVFVCAPPPCLPPPLHHHIKHYLLNNTMMWDKARFQGEHEKRVKTTETGLYHLTLSRRRMVGGDEVLMRWHGVGVVSQGRDNPSSHGGPCVLGL